MLGRYDYLIEFVKCVQSPEYFIYKYCLTFDTLAKLEREPFPDLPHIKYLINLYQRDNMIMVAKSRQMMVTWTFCALLLWQAMFHPAQLCVIQCLREENADDHVKNKIYYMWKNLPQWLKEEKPARYIYCHFIMEDGSQSMIKGLQQGGNAIRQFTASVVLSDEMAFQPEAEDAFSASIPATMGSGDKRGKYIGVSTPYGENFFYHQWDDDYRDWDVISRGLMEKHNPNGFTAVALHFSADPGRGPEWEAELRKFYRNNVDKFEREYNLNFKIVEGQKYYKEYSIEVHEKKDLTAIQGRPLLRSWDFGYRHPGMTVSQLNTLDQWVILLELLGTNIALPAFVRQAIDLCYMSFPDFIQRQNSANDYTDYVDYCDVAGRQVNDKSDKTSIEIMGSHPFYIFPINSKAEKKRGLQIIRQHLLVRGDGRPGIIIDPIKCPLLADGFRGAFHYKKDKDGQLKDENYAADNNCIHLIDTLKYVAHNNATLASILNWPEEERPKTVPEMDEREYAQWHINNHGVSPIRKTREKPNCRRINGYPNRI